MLQLREKASQAKSEAGGLAPLAHGVLEAQKEEQRRASELAALKRYSTTSICVDSQYAHRHNIRDRWLREVATVRCRHQFLPACFILHKYAPVYLADCACSVKCKIYIIFAGRHRSVSAHRDNAKAIQHILLHVLVLSNATVHHLCRTASVCVCF